MNRLAMPLRNVYLICAGSLLALALAASAGNASAQSGAKLRVNFIAPKSADPAPLVRYLEKETGAAIELTSSKSSEDTLEGMTKKEIDIASLGGLEFVQASAHLGAKPLVQKEEDQKAQTVFITQPDLPIHNLTDLKGHTLAFAVVTSVSSHVMPQYYLRDAKVDPDVMKKAIYTERDVQVMAVANKKVDAAVVNPNRLKTMIKEGKLIDGQVRVFWTSPPFPDTVWAARGDVDPKLAGKFADAFLKLDAKNPEHKQVLDLLQATAFARANDAGYDNLRAGAKAAGLLK